MPQVSVVMPVYNAGEFLGAAIDSVLAQSFADWELICVDDGSTDGSGGVCEAYAARDPRIVVHRQENGGICAARNRGVSLARGEYVAFIDNDDEYRPGLLERAVALIREHGAQLVKFGYRVEETFRDDSTWVRETHAEALTLLGSGDAAGRLEELRRGGFFYMVWNGLYRRDFIERFPFDETIRFGYEDWVFNFTVCPEVEKAVVCPEVLYVHYQRESMSTSKKFYPERLEGCVAAARTEKAMLVKLGLLPENGLNDIWLGRLILYLLEILSLLNLTNNRPSPAEQKRQYRRAMAMEPMTDLEKYGRADVRALTRKRKLLVFLNRRSRIRSLLFLERQFKRIQRSK